MSDCQTRPTAGLAFSLLFYFCLRRKKARAPSVNLSIYKHSHNLYGSIAAQQNTQCTSIRDLPLRRNTITRNPQNPCTTKSQQITHPQILSTPNQSQCDYFVSYCSLCSNNVNLKINDALH